MPKRKPFVVTRAIQFKGCACTSGYYLEERKREEFVLQSILGYPPWETLDIVAAGPEFETFETELTDGALFVDFLNAPRTYNGALDFVKKWGLPGRNQRSLDTESFFNNRDDVRYWMSKAVHFHKSREAKLHDDLVQEKKLRDDLIQLAQNPYVGKQLTIQINEEGQFIPKLSLVATSQWQFMRMCIFHSAFVEPLAVPCKNDRCDRFVQVTPLGRPNLICSVACRQSSSRANKRTDVQSKTRSGSSAKKRTSHEANSKRPRRP